MKTCYLCNREIENGKKILNNGIQYVCSNSDTICKKIQQTINDAKSKLNFTEKQEQIKNSGGTLINCSCKKSFYTLFPLETDPPCDYCVYCGEIHRK
jgi:hypothetical protein